MAKPPAGQGHNSGDVLMGAAQDKLKSLVTSIEYIIDDQISPAKEEIKTLYADAKAAGFKPAVLRKLVALRAKEKAKLLEEKAILELYAHAMGVEDLV